MKRLSPRVVEQRCGEHVEESGWARLHAAPRRKGLRRHRPGARSARNLSPQGRRPRRERPRRPELRRASTCGSRASGVSNGTSSGMAAGPSALRIAAAATSYSAAAAHSPYWSSSSSARLRRQFFGLVALQQWHEDGGASEARRISHGQVSENPERRRARIACSVNDEDRTSSGSSSHDSSSASGLSGRTRVRRTTIPVGSTSGQPGLNYRDPWIADLRHGGVRQDCGWSPTST